MLAHTCAEFLDSVTAGTWGAPGARWGSFRLGAAVPVIRARALEKRYGRRRALRPLDLDLGEGGFLVVTGPNGSGKTTLLRLVAGLVAPTRGTLEVEPSAAGSGIWATSRCSIAT